MEIRQGKQKLLIFLRFLACFVLFLGNFLVTTNQVSSESFRWLVSDFNTVLEHWYWEIFAWCWSQPQSIFRANSVLVLVFLDLLKLRHPRCWQVTILQADPVSRLLSFINKSFSNDTLSLTKRDGLHALFHAWLLGKLVKICNRISTRGQYKDNRSSACWISESTLQIKWWTHDILQT